MSVGMYGQRTKESLSYICDQTANLPGKEEEEEGEEKGLG